MSTLDVLLGETRVGALEQFEDENYVFAFDEAWVSDPDRPILGQFFEDRRPRNVEVSGPPCWFAHLLPQGPLRRAIARSVGLDEADVFDLLRLLGEDLPGAVIMRPGVSRLQRPHVPPEPEFHSSYAVAGALAGVQWKLSVRPGERGLVVPVAGETGSWIAKFHDPGLRELPRIEFATSQWARACGVEMPNVRLGRVDEFTELPPGIPTGDGSVYLIERFDRGPEQRRIHMEDLAQVLDRPPGQQQYSGNYEQLAAVLAAVTPDDVRAFCERLVFCVLCGNTDAHLKNWSLLYTHPRVPRLSPAYDLVASVLYAPAQVEDSLALPLDGSSRFEDVRMASFQRLAAVCRRPFGEVRAWISGMAERVRTAWAEQAHQWAFTDAERVRLAAHLRRVPLPG